ncbi:tRNA 4-thiouridine(8) synthase ThiI [Bacillaceae bacterium Marseille-Q3522]|nr:tRNA 4-thiouridine(8) synthase ThiI [Bacillaceae bacterium Marseille-Q3522]
MNYDRILIRYGEISTKGRNRGSFVEKLQKSVKRSLAGLSNVKIDAKRDRMYVILNGENAHKAIGKLQNIFGIQSLSPAITVEKELEKMKQQALVLLNNYYEDGKTFKVTVKRADKTFPLKTDELNQLFGSYLLTHTPNLTVNVRQPDINIRIEIRKEAAYLSCETIKGAGGMPGGSNGKGMLMLSGGIDSPVAGYLAMKRGLYVEGVHFFSPPFTSERAKQKVLDLAEKLAEVNGTFTLHIVPFTEIQQLIHQQIPENYSMTSTRRVMMRITDRIREKNNALAIITGESIGQVASQTLESMTAINAVTATPVIRPLITMDKIEIMDIARKLDTYDISSRPFEDCCTIFVPSSPKTRPKLEKVEHYESFLQMEPLIQEAIEKTETIVIRPNKKTEEIANLF